MSGLPRIHCPESNGTGVRIALEWVSGMPRNTHLLSSHNYYITEKVATDLYANASDLLSFEGFLRSRTPKLRLIEDLVQCLSVVDVYRDVDLYVLASILRSAG